MSNALLEDQSAVDLSADNLEQEILAQIEEQDALTLDTLILILPRYSWSQIFHAVDSLARSGKIVLRRHRFDYTIFSTHFAA